MKKKISAATFILIMVFVGCRATTAYSENVTFLTGESCSEKMMQANFLPDLINFPGKKSVHYRHVPKTLTVIVFGQSMSTNSFEVRRSCGKKCFQLNHLDGKFYQGSDPFLGITGDGGSLMSRLGKLFIEQGRYKQVLFVPVGVGATSIKQWIGCKNLYERVVSAYNLLHKHNIEPDLILWMQGESDSSTPGWGDIGAAEYAGLFASMVNEFRNNGIMSPIFVAQSSVCLNNGSPNVIYAQKIVSGHLRGVYSGPNTDLIKKEYRFDGCHYSDSGLDLVAKLWFDTIMQYKIKTNQLKTKDLTTNRQASQPVAQHRTHHWDHVRNGAQGTPGSSL